MAKGKATREGNKKKEVKKTAKAKEAVVKQAVAKKAEKRSGLNEKKELYPVDKLVWAKLRFCPFWPARVCTAPPEIKGRGKNKVCVFFFGSKNL